MSTLLAADPDHDTFLLIFLRCLSGAAVKMAEDRGCTLFDLTVKDLQTIHPLFADDVIQVRAEGGRRRGRWKDGQALPSGDAFPADVLLLLTLLPFSSSLWDRPGLGLQPLRRDARHRGRRQQAQRHAAGREDEDVSTDCLRLHACFLKGAGGCLARRRLCVT
jgi:hypothetical protein